MRESWEDSSGGKGQRVCQDLTLGVGRRGHAPEDGRAFNTGAGARGSHGGKEEPAVAPRDGIVGRARGLGDLTSALADQGCKGTCTKPCARARAKMATGAAWENTQHKTAPNESTYSTNNRYFFNYSLTGHHLIQFYICVLRRMPATSTPSGTHLCSIDWHAKLFHLSQRHGACTQASQLCKLRAAFMAQGVHASFVNYGMTDLNN
jgi:hypothetical protein